MTKYASMITFRIFYLTVMDYHHCGDVIMSAIASQITDVSIVYSTVCSGADQRKHQCSASLAFVWGIHRWLMDNPHKGLVTRKMFPFDDAIMMLFVHWHYRVHEILYYIHHVLFKHFSFTMTVSNLNVLTFPLWPFDKFSVSSNILFLHM